MALWPWGVSASRATPGACWPIEDLLRMSRIESGAIKINASAVPPEAVVSGALEALAGVRSAHRVDLPDESVLGYGDRGQLARIVINLVDTP